MLADKKDLECEEDDFFALAALCFTKHNVDKWMLTPEKRSHILYSGFGIAFITFAMLGCIIWEKMTSSVKFAFPESYSVFLVKVPCAIALHITLYPEVAHGMEIMKFAH